ncbi:MAG: hypothetical protein WBP11_02930 [Dokdonella sp.]
MTSNIYPLDSGLRRGNEIAEDSHHFYPRDPGLRRGNELAEGGALDG